MKILTWLFETPDLWQPAESCVHRNNTVKNYALQPFATEKNEATLTICSISKMQMYIDPHASQAEEFHTI